MVWRPRDFTPRVHHIGITLLLLSLILGLPATTRAQNLTPTDFESGFGSWSTDDPAIWQVGVPSSGPRISHSGAKCAGTVLDGTYPANSSARLISPAFVVPAAGLMPQLSFWHWFEFSGLSTGDDYGQLQVKVDGGAWTDLPVQYFESGGAWTRALADLGGLANHMIQLGFYFKSNAITNMSGWYVDDVSVITSPYQDLVTQPEGFESGMGDWSADQGQWEVGKPFSAPGHAKFGQGCAGTVLGGSYAPLAESRLVSPPFVVPTAAANPRLSFWHWFEFSGLSINDDFAKVQIRPVGGTWTDLATPIYFESSGGWTHALADLGDFADDLVQIGFYFKSNAYTNLSGWYVDQISIETGPYRDLTQRGEGFDFTVDGWSADRGVWQYGELLAGPAAAHSRIGCAGTVLSDTYPANADSRLMSPPFTVSATPLDGKVWLSFWHWFQGSGLSTADDYGVVQVRTLGETWTDLSGLYMEQMTNWTNVILDLSGYLGDTIQIGFRFKSNANTNFYGWYVDDVSIVEGPKVFNNTEDFEHGSLGWYASRGVWDIDTPTFGPAGAHSGNRCAGTNVKGTYEPYSDSSLISSPFVVPNDGGSPTLSFWHWYSMSGTTTADDYGAVYLISQNGTPVQISPNYFDQSSGWVEENLSLSGYIGQTVQLAFRFRSNCCTNYAGWYVDDVTVSGLTTQVPPPPTFDLISYTAGAPQLQWTWPAGSYSFVSIYAATEADRIPDFGCRIIRTTASSFADAARPGWHYHYWLATVDPSGKESPPVGPLDATSVNDGSPGSQASHRLILDQNYPNPFNPRTMIRFELTHTAHAVLQVFDVAGRLITTLVDEERPAGMNEVVWQGTDSRGREVATGVYLYRLSAGDFVQTKRMVLLR